MTSSTSSCSCRVTTYAQCVALIARSRSFGLTRLAGISPLNNLPHSLPSAENRAFDHYYGMLRGVRGYNDRYAAVFLWRVFPSCSFFFPSNDERMSGPQT